MLTRNQIAVSELAPQSHHEARRAGRELSNPEDRRGYRRTAILASAVAAELGREVERARDALAACDLEAEEHWRRDLADSLERMELVCFSLIGADK